MFLAIDIGNTNIKMALFKGRRIAASFRLPTDKSASIGDYQKRLKKLLGRKIGGQTEVEKIIICSVVPRLTAKLQKALSLLVKSRALVLGRDIAAPIKNCYRKPKQVGQDRLANAVAALHRYGGPCVIVDFGTALTFDLVSAAGSYLGGIIVPGIEIALQALIKNADLLPQVVLTRPQELLGRDTVSSIRSGIIYGYACLVEGMLARLKKQFGRRPKVIATGGKADLLRRYCRSIDKVEPNLTLYGLALSLANSKKKKAKKQ